MAYLEGTHFSGGIRYLNPRMLALKYCTGVLWQSTYLTFFAHYNTSTITDSFLRTEVLKNFWSWTPMTHHLRN